MKLTTQDRAVETCPQKASGWRDPDLSCANRVMLYMSAHPQDVVGVAALYRGGVEDHHSAIRGALHKLHDEGSIIRVSKGRYQWKDST